MTDELERLRDSIRQLAARWELDIKRYEDSLSIGAIPAVAFETRITNTMGHLSDLNRLLSQSEPHTHVWTRTIAEREDGLPFYCHSCGEKADDDDSH